MKNNKISNDKSKNNKKLNHSMIEDKLNRKYNINKSSVEKVHNYENSSLKINKTNYNNDIFSQKIKRRTLRNSLKTIHNSNSVILNDRDYYNNMEIMINDIHKEGFENLKFKIKKREIQKNELLNSINNIKKQINFINNRKKYWNNENAKVEKELKQIKNISERIKYDNSIIDK